MNKLKNRIKELIEKKEIDIFIGYEAGILRPRPLFVTRAQEVEKLIFNDSCTGNLAVYLTRKELTEGKRVGIWASWYTLKSIVQLFGENQLKEGALLIFYPRGEEFVELSKLTEVREELKAASPSPKTDDAERIAQLSQMSREQRWKFWSGELSRCFKCYACRAACPMCYCTRCIVEVNQPQWIHPWATTQSNMEWQIARVMHMAGRCSDCGSCGSACPVGIPIHLLSHFLRESVAQNFGDPEEQGNVLSVFKPGDSENFIR